jgi:hypothetical protein
VRERAEWASRLPEFLPRTLAWAAAQSQLILQNGVSLDAPAQAVARAVGVKQPDRIRLWTVVDIPAPSDPELRQLALDENLIGPGTGGLTLGYGILIRRGRLDLRLLSHECRHVHQVEAAGGLEAFLALYLRQIADFTYENAPYEQDAKAHELKTWP